MSEATERKPPLPLILSFVACREIWCDQRTNTYIVVAPTREVSAAHFPTHVRLSFFVELTGGHGSYQPRMALRDIEDEVVWGWTGNHPFESDNPLVPHQVTFLDILVAVPRPGAYRFVFQLNGEDAAQRPMWFRPLQPDRPQGPGGD